MINVWSSRIQEASKILGISDAELEAILDDPSFKITSSHMRVEMISDPEITPFGDLRRLLCEKNPFSVPQARMVEKVLRGKKETGDSKDFNQLLSANNIPMSIEDLPIEDLIKYYDPRCKNKVYSVLKERYGDKPVIVFNSETDLIDVEETINYIYDHENGQGNETTHMVGNEIVELYKIGEIPNQIVDEDPAFPGVPLRKNRSTVNRVSWDGINIETRQFFRILVNRKDINPNNRMDVLNLLSNEWNKITTTFPEAHLEYKKLKKNNDLPKLRISLRENTSKMENPFSIKHKQY